MTFTQTEIEQILKAMPEGRYSFFGENDMYHSPADIVQLVIHALQKVGFIVIDEDGFESLLDENYRRGQRSMG